MLHIYADLGIHEAKYYAAIFRDRHFILIIIIAQDSINADYWPLFDCALISSRRLSIAIYHRTGRQKNKAFITSTTASRHFGQNAEILYLCTALYGRRIAEIIFDSYFLYFLEMAHFRRFIYSRGKTPLTQRQRNHHLS
jgi:hypothetical protein